MGTCGSMEMPKIPGMPDVPKVPGMEFMPSHDQIKEYRAKYDEASKKHVDAIGAFKKKYDAAGGKGGDKEKAYKQCAPEVKKVKDGVEKDLKLHSTLKEKSQEQVEKGRVEFYKQRAEAWEQVPEDMRQNLGDAGKKTFDASCEKAFDTGVAKALDAAVDKVYEQLLCGEAMTQLLSAEKDIKAKQSKVSESLDMGVAAMKGDADAQMWKNLSKIWKTADGQSFDDAALEKHFPATRATIADRKKLWSEADPNGNGLLSLSEYSAWFNAHTIKCVQKHDPEAMKDDSKGQSDIYKYAKKSLIRSFELANGVSDKEVKIGGKSVGQDYVTKAEFRVLMCATQAVLICTRIFDRIDVTGDKRIGQAEWDKNLDMINARLHTLCPGCKTVESSCFSKIDNDGAGAVLLDEAVYFLLPYVTNDPALLKERNEEGC